MGLRRRLAIVLACAAPLACPAHNEAIPGIHVDPRAAQRLGWLGGSAAKQEGLKGVRSRVHVMDRGGELGGPNAIGRPGDLVLENDEVVFVIDQLGSSWGFAESGGNIVDAGDAHDRKDELGQMFTYFGTFPRQAVYETLASGVSTDGSAWVEAKGRELREESLAVTTRYTLRPPDRALSIETTLDNGGDVAVELPSLGDAVQWGGAEKIAPGKPRGFRGPSSGPYIGGVGRFTSYAVTSTEGTIDGTSGGFWTDTSQRRAVKIAPHERTSYARVFVVGERPDTSSLVGELAMVAGQPVGRLRVALVGSTSLPIRAVVTLLADGSHAKVTIAQPFSAELPVGRYWVEPMPGRSTGAAPLGPVDVGAAAEARIDVPVEPPAKLELACTAPDVGGTTRASPCKVTLQGLGTTPDPDFGPTHAAGPARNQATTADGSVRLVVAPGRYRITASRGPEYSIASVDVDLAPDENRLETMPIARVVDTGGYVACDFHQHTMRSADSPVATRDRVIANAAEGVEVAVASEHNVVADLEPVVRELHLEKELVAIAGDELTSDASRHPWGHANVFPLPFDSAAKHGGAPSVRDRTPRELFEGLRANSNDLVVQVNHPRSGSSGYFDLLHFDRSRGLGKDPDYEVGFDAVEVWNGRNVDARATVIDDWRALLRTGHVVTATADTDTHGVVGQEAGYPRTYVRVANDGGFDSWDGARTQQLVGGIKVSRDVVLTNGPMLRASANGVPIGGVARGPIVTLKVHVECAPWVSVDTVRLLRATDAPAGKGDAKSLKLVPLPSGAWGADVTFVRRIDVDDALFVIASGTKPLSPVLGGDEREILPWAMTGALWVDADGDGRALGRMAVRSSNAPR